MVVVDDVVVDDVVVVGAAVEVVVVVVAELTETTCAVPLLVPSAPMTVSATLYVPASGNVCEIVAWVVSIVLFWGCGPGASLNCHTYSATPPVAVEVLASKLTVVPAPGVCVKLAVAVFPFEVQKSRQSCP